MQWQRPFTSSFPKFHGDIVRPKKGTGIKVHFVDSKKNPIKTIETNEGDDLLHLAHEWDVDLEGACEASCACSTCHVILEPEVFDQLEEPSDDENDMLDLAFGLTDTLSSTCAKNYGWYGRSATVSDKEYVRRWAERNHISIK
ncbi:hypothetical protein E3Q08_03564 [Wallemia mellicola]|nr:hypothetical protein E3Q11_03287 [Wallemia mellicola]TIC31413.1 hypothetical protein E3Q09_04005 [Wallemia mellicola]TIC40877.1 hypothetical protein E3Q08_03564 [Wallemia mellicola]TIC52703.1 hypothetical protein E3Q04_03390 [Wallemia mellicola]